MVGAGLYESDEEAAKRERVLCQLKQVTWCPYLFLYVLVIIQLNYLEEFLREKGLAAKRELIGAVLFLGFFKNLAQLCEIDNIRFPILLHLLIVEHPFDASLVFPVWIS